MAQTDQQIDAALAQRLAAYDERITIAQAAQVGLSVELAAATDPDRRAGLAYQIVAQQQDIDTLRLIMVEVAKIAGKADSATKLRAKASQANAAAVAVLAEAGQQTAVKSEM